MYVMQQEGISFNTNFNRKFFYTINKIVIKFWIFYRKHFSVTLYISETNLSQSIFFFFGGGEETLGNFLRPNFKDRISWQLTGGSRNRFSVIFTVKTWNTKIFPIFSDIRFQYLSQRFPRSQAFQKLHVNTFESATTPSKFL